MQPRFTEALRGRLVLTPVQSSTGETRRCLQPGTFRLSGVVSRDLHRGDADPDGQGHRMVRNTYRTLETPCAT